MKPEYATALIIAGLGVLGWGIRVFLKFTNELTEWRVKIFGQNGVIATQTDHETRIETIERRLGWEGEFGRRATDHPVTQ